MVENEQWYSSSFWMEVTTVTNIYPPVKFIVLISIFQGGNLSLRNPKPYYAMILEASLILGQKTSLFSDQVIDP